MERQGEAATESIIMYFRSNALDYVVEQLVPFLGLQGHHVKVCSMPPNGRRAGLE